MNEKKIDQLINIVYSLSAFAVLLGAFFRLQHYPYGNELLWGGFIAGTIVSNIFIRRLKNTIKKLEKQSITK